MSWLRSPNFMISPKAICAVAATGSLGICVVLLTIQGAADDFDDAAAPQRQHPAHGTHFWFEVIESFNAKYEGDTPGHIGRGGGLTLHPHVALGDAVYRRTGDDDLAIGVVTGVTWDRLRGSLTVEFHPKENHRIAVGDEVWIDLNPATPTQGTRQAGDSPPAGDLKQAHSAASDADGLAFYAMACTA